VSELARRIEALPTEKRALLEKRLLQQRAVAGSGSTMIPRRRPGPCPLSFSQQRLWFLDQWRPGSPVYNAVLPMRLRGPLDAEALRWAFESLVGRHEALRTVFEARREGPVQVVVAGAPFKLAEIDLRGVAPAEQNEQALALLRDRGRKPFDLARDTMLRATLVRLGDEDSLLQLEEHHIAFDGWSDGILFRDLEELYAARIGDRSLDLPALPIQYGDFAAWQRSQLAGERLDQLLRYWRVQLAAAPPVLRLPADHPRPEVQTFEGAHLPIRLPGRLADTVRQRSREESVTPFMLLLAAFATLLYRATGQDDIVIGTPIANRDQLELEHLIGFFSNTLPLRVRLHGNPTFRELVSRVRETALGAYANQDLPFERIVEAVRPDRNAAVNPLFQANFRVQTGRPAQLALPGLAIEPISVDVGFARFDVAAELQIREDRIEGYLEYNLQLFERTTAEQIGRAFEQLLAQVLERPGRTLLELQLPAIQQRTGTRPRPELRRGRQRTTLDPIPTAN
jgi:hypothetical protein